MKKRCLTLFLLFLTFAVFPQAFISSNLPVVLINTNGQTIVDEPKIMADMGIIYNGPGIRNNLSDPFNHYNGKIGIEIRGQSSQMFPMKSYSVDLWDASGNGISRSLLGLPSESDWVLYAPYTDKTLMRNFLAYTMSREMGHWASNCRYVEVVLNGDYKGIYVLMEKIKRGSNRVNITRINNTDISGDPLTGGYIFSLDKEPDGWFSSYATPYSPVNAKRQFSYVYPKPENIVPAQKDYIKAIVDSFENALMAANYRDKINGVRKFADISSFVDYLIVNEVSRNVDGYRLSSYFHKDRNSKNPKIKAGPVWDYDLAFRNADYCKGSEVAGWAYQFNSVCPNDGAGLIPFWWDRFVQDTAFKAELRCRWKQLRQTSLSDLRLNTLIDSVANLTAEARQRHFTRWPVLGQYVWPNPQPIAFTYEEEITYLKAWMAQRIAWISDNIPNEGACEDWPRNLSATMVAEIYPNPVTVQSKIRLKTKTNQRVKLNVYAASGRLVHTSLINTVAVTNFITDINIGSWAGGFYIFSFENEAGEKIRIKTVK